MKKFLFIFLLIFCNNILNSEYVNSHYIQLDKKVLNHCPEIWMWFGSSEFIAYDVTKLKNNIIPLNQYCSKIAILVESELEPKRKKIHQSYDIDGFHSYVLKDIHKKRFYLLYKIKTR